MHPLKGFTLSTLLIATFLGCTSRTDVRTVRITDPDAGLSVDIPVQGNGTFSHTFKKDSFESVASGTIRDGDGTHAVALSYERKQHAETGKRTSEKIEATFTAPSDIEVPIGRNPSQPHPNPSSSDNSLVNVTVTLLHGHGPAR
jgi:hypothetical protein